MNEKLKKLDEYIISRQKAASFYDLNLTAVSEFVTTPKRASYSTHVFHQYTLKVGEKRDELKSFLFEKGIPSMIYYPLPVPQQKAYNHYTKDSFGESEKLSGQVLSLPMHTHLKEEQQQFICDTIKAFFL